jgi:hypothetical protein
MVGACRSTRDAGISVVRMCGALCVDGGGPGTSRHGVECGAEQRHRVALVRSKSKRKDIQVVARNEKKGHRERQTGLREREFIGSLYHHVPVRRIRFRRLGVPLRAMQSPRLFACDRFLSLPLSCLGPSRIAKRLLRLAALREERGRELPMRTGHRLQIKMEGDVPLFHPPLLCIAIMCFDGYL